MFYFAKQKLLITSDNTAYPVSVFYKNLRPNSASFHFAELRIRRNVMNINFKNLDDGTKNVVKNFSERAKIGGVQGEENFCPRTVSKIAKKFCVNQSASGFCSKWVRTSSNKHHIRRFVFSSPLAEFTPYRALLLFGARGGEEAQRI